MSKKVCVLISGCGVYDGAEIHESVVTLLSLSKEGAEAVVAAPHKEQTHVINHHTGQEVAGATRMVHEEAARIARGPVLDVSEVNVSDFDALFMPGGFGAAKNLSDVAFKGAEATIDPGVGKLINEFHSAGKPIGAVCIAPAVLALALGKGKVTIGSDPGTAGAIQAFGAQHENCVVTESVVDRENKLATAPAYMCEASIHQVAAGIEKTVQAVLSMC